MAHADEYCQVSNGRIRTARTEHRCNACREKIRYGDTYYSHTGLLDGMWEATKQCSRCHAIFKAIAAKGEGPVLLTLDCGESWEDAFGEPCPDEIAALAFRLPSDPILETEQ